MIPALRAASPTRRCARSTAGLLLVLALAGLAGCSTGPTPAGPVPGAAAPGSAGPGAPTGPSAPAPSTATAAQSAPAASASPAAPPPTLPYDQAVLSAATSVLKPAAGAAAAPPPKPQAIVIDPLIDGMTGMQSATTQATGQRLAQLIRTQYPQLALLPFSAASVVSAPLVLIGTITGVNAQRQAAGAREAFRICFALADLKTGKLVSKGLAFAQGAGVDATPLAFYRDAPAFTDDPATLGYIRTCQGTKAGDPIHPLYVDRILVAAQVAEAIEAYDAGRYAQALSLYSSAQRSPAGDQFRVYNGLYLSHWKLGHRAQADAAFKQIVDHGLAQKRLAVKFLFRPGAVAFADAKLSAPYPGWISAIGSRASAAGACLEVVGHTSATGPEPLNERLSQLRAEHLKSLLETSAPLLAKRTIASGMGSRQMLVGNGRDDVSDALDRRVEFKVIGC